MPTVHIKKKVAENVFANEHSLIASEYRLAYITSHHALLGLNKTISVEGALFGTTPNIICPDG
ncbi:unnamed protein product, partial [Rotaria sordida]